MSKNLIVLCDGTGNSPEANFITNVQILRELLGVEVLGNRAKNFNFTEGWEVDDYDLEDAKRLVYYDRGIGSPKLDKNGNVIKWSWNLQGFFRNGLVIYNHFKTAHEQIKANGIIDNVAQAYRFLVNNYEPGDRIFLFGFSRGAYTLRILVTIIRYIGLLDKSLFRNESEIKSAIEIGFRLYNMNVHPDLNPKTQLFRQKCHQPENIIHFLGLWDTVRGLIEERVHSDAKLSSAVKIARHALAIDEQRKIFKPEVWIASDNTDSIQMWFAGVHSDIGGGYHDRGLSSICLEWMLSEANKFGLGINPEVLKHVNLIPNPLAPQHDSYNARIQDNLDLTWKDLGYFRRPVMQMTKCETLHPSVLQRYGKTVKKCNDNIVYQPPILSHELTAYRNFKRLDSLTFAEMLEKIELPDANTLADVGERTSLIPKP